MASSLSRTLHLMALQDEDPAQCMSGMSFSDAMVVMCLQGKGGPAGGRGGRREVCWPQQRALQIQQHDQGGLAPQQQGQGPRGPRKGDNPAVLQIHTPIRRKDHQELSILLDAGPLAPASALPSRAPIQRVKGSIDVDSHLQIHQAPCIWR